MQKQINLYRGLTCWLAEFVGDVETMELFGTTTLPTPYTPEMEEEIVSKEIREKNPGCEVRVCEI